MKIHLVTLIVLTAVTLFSLRPLICRAAPAILGYYTFDDSSYDSIANFGTSIDQISTDSFTVSGDGSIDGKAPTKAIALAKSKGAVAYACISNYGKTDFDPKIVHDIVSNPTAVTAITCNLLALLKSNLYAGVNIDFESIRKEDRDAYTDFVRHVSKSMHAAGYKTVISVPAELCDNPKDSWTGAFDLARLGKYVDLVQLMTYDESGPWAGPGPVAGIDWVRSAAKYAVSVIPASKVSLGMAAYGYDWDTTHKTTTTVNWHKMPSLITSSNSTPHRDFKSGSPHFKYVAVDGSKHTVWYEDSKSIHQKAKLAASMNMAGVSVWALGKEDASFWKAVKTGLHPHQK